MLQEAEKDLGEKILDGYYLLNCAKLDDPQDICSVDISNQGKIAFSRCGMQIVVIVQNRHLL